MDNHWKYEGLVEATLTTIDNPWDPFEQFDDWLQFDNRMGYNTLGILGTICDIKEGMNVYEETKIIEEACEKFVAGFPFELYKVVRREFVPPRYSTEVLGDDGELHEPPEL